MAAAANPGDLQAGERRPVWAQEVGESAAGGARSPVNQRGTVRAQQQAGHPPVTIETTSTDSAYSKKSPVGGDDAFYTSLMSDERYMSQPDSSYFTGILKKENSGTRLDNEELCFGYHSQDVPIFDSRGLFSSDSGIEMTPAESKDVIKTLSDPMEDDKLGAYKYIDIRRSPDIKPQKSPEQEVDEGKAAPFAYEFSAKGRMHDGATKTWEKDLYNDQVYEDLSFAPYMEEAGDHMGLYSSTVTRNTKTSPVKITLTGTDSSIESDFIESSQDLYDAGLKPGSDMVPTVMVSEPEDDSPESLTPPSTDTDGYTEPSGSEKQSKFRISEDELISAMKAKEATKGFPYEAVEEQKPHSVSSVKQDYKSMPVLPAVPSSLDNEVSSTESGDSEIELVSEDQLAGEEAMQSAYMTFSHISGPPPSPASPSIQYSILREEREAELDSELIIESCDGSSASEESPKRDQDSPMMKPMMDIIEEENSSRTESFDASDFDSCSSTERKLNMENLAESAAYLKSSYLAEGRAEFLVIKRDEALHQRKVPESAAHQSRLSGKPSAGSQASVAWLSKKKAVDLLYWRDVKQSAIVFGSVLLMLFSLTQFSVVSVIAYLALAALSATISFRIYKSVLQAVQKTDEGHPFKSYLDLEVSLSQEQIQKYTDCLQVYTNSIVRELRRLFLVQDLVDSLKFAVLMWLLTYVGALFNGLTLLIMAVVSMFSLPAVYDKYQAQIDQYLGLVRTNMNTVVAKIQAKIPGAKLKE
ncbi:reticulon-1 isoform X1 [Pseudophryne corroboree]|uniref:reticulon-1 isoform X1 n=1 Tax=Pseudophryne corroboree TaxID=495146 RepID=UPI0030816048